MKKLYKSNNRMICGVCAGVAEYFGIDPTIVRLIWAALALSGTGILLYIVAAIVISRRPSGLRKTMDLANSLAHRTTWLRSDFSQVLAGSGSRTLTMTLGYTEGQEVVLNVMSQGYLPGVEESYMTFSLGSKQFVLPQESYADFTNCINTCRLAQ